MIEYFKLALKNISRRKIRTFLTVLGILIGMSSVIALVTIGEGANKRIENIFEKMGKDKITIFPGKMQGMSGAGMLSSIVLTEEDVKAIEKLPNVEEVVPIFFRSTSVKFGREEVYLSVSGIGGDLEEVINVFQGFSLKSGRYIRGGEKGKCILGYGTANDLFDKKIKVGDKIEISGKKFKVVGILDQIGSKMDDYSIIISLDDARELFNEEEEVSMILVKVRDEGIIDDTVEAIKKKLKKRHDNKEDFSVLTQKQLLEKISEVLGILQFILIAIASISLLVGSIGIMNSMYTSVMERTKDIGTMKAIGATNFQVMFVFLIESGILGFFGGLIGIILGLFSSKLLLDYALHLGFTMPFVIDPILIVGVLLISFFLGVISGILPALRAARLDPAEALRYE